MHFSKLLIVTTILILSACDSSSTSSSSTDFTTGYIQDVENKKKAIDLDITEWMDSDKRVGHMAKVAMTEDVTIQNEKGEKLSFKKLKLGQKVKLEPSVKPVEDWTSGTLTLLDMTREEKLNQFFRLDNNEGVTTAVVYNDHPEPFSVGQIEEKAPRAFGDGVIWKHYKSNFVIDIKKEFNINKFPVILVFEEDELVLKTYKLEKAKQFLNRIRD